MHILPKNFLLTGLMALLVSACSQQDADVGTQRNIVLITLDCLRADRVAAYGGNPEWMPNLNALAEQGTVFMNAYTAAGTTFPSHATMLTGLYPRYHGVRSNEHTLADKYTTVAEVLSQHGYATGSFVSFRQMHFAGNLDQGFDVIGNPERGVSEESLLDGGEVTALAMDWLNHIETRDDQPFFLWVHYFDAHKPYRVNKFSRQRLRGYDGILKDGATVEMVHEHKSEILASEEDLKALRVLYNGEAHKADGHVGGLLKKIRALDEADRTTIIVVADHGQALGSRGHMGHGPILWEEVLRIPFIITELGEPISQRIQQVVGTVDLTPTILDIAGIESNIQVQGRSLMPALETTVLEPWTYYSEVERKPNPMDYGDWYTEDRVAVYDRGFKLLYRPQASPQLFDLTQDPYAERPLNLKQHPTLMDYMVGLAQDFLSNEVDSQRASLTETDIETLRSLGYIQ